MLRKIRLEFLASEEGAVATDWVVASALVVGLCIAIYTNVGTAAHDYGELVSDEMNTRGIVAY